MSRAQPQQARGFEFYPQGIPQQQQQQQQQPRQLPSGIQPALSFQTTAPTLSSSPCNQYVASPRLPTGINAPQAPPAQGQAGGPSAMYTEPTQFSDVRRPPVNAPTEADGVRRELEKSRAQIAQLEKTLKWWSDCTANWREKWGKEKAERRKLKDELTQVRASYDQTMARELERIKHEMEEGRGGDEIGSGIKRVNGSKLTTTGVGTGDTLQRFAQSSMERSTRGEQIGLSIPTESTANFELQELVAETSSALEHERSENTELKSEIERLTAEQSALKTELNLLKETISAISAGREGGGEVNSADTQSVTGLHGLPRSVTELIDSLQSKIEKLEKDVAARQMEHLSDWSIIDRLESERALLRADNERLTTKLEDFERTVTQKSGEGDDPSDAENLKAKEVESLRAEVHCLRRLVNRQTQELDHVNFMLSNQETETKLLRSRLLQPWGASAQRATNPVTSSGGSASFQSQQSSQ